MDESAFGLARLPQLSSLRVFEAAARYESFMKAAAALHVTQGAVSKQIKSLELDLGEPLFDRRNRAVFLTERGRSLAMRLSGVFCDLEEVLADFKSNRDDEPLIVSCEPTLCLKVLIPGLSDLKDKTGLDVRVLAAGGRVDFRRDHVHLAVRRNDFPIDGTIVAHPLAAEAMGLVCAPSVRVDIRKRLPLPALHSRSRPEAWAAWAKSGGPKVCCSGDVVYEHFYMAIEAAMAGQGVALVSRHMVFADLQAGRLDALSDFKPDGTHYVALSAQEIAEDRREARFISWLAARMRGHLEPARDGDAMPSAVTPAP